MHMVENTTETIKKKRQAMAMMVLATLLWSSGGILIKLIHWNPLFIAGSRSLISAAVIAIMMKVD